MIELQYSCNKTPSWKNPFSEKDGTAYIHMCVCHGIGNFNVENEAFTSIYVVESSKESSFSKKVSIVIPMSKLCEFVREYEREVRCNVDYIFGGGI